MTDQNKSNHWDLLASEIGAKPPPTDEEDRPGSVPGQSESSQPATPGPPQPETPQPETPQPETPPPEPATGPKRPTPDWDALASELGILPEPATDKGTPEEIPIERPSELVAEPANSITEVTEHAAGAVTGTVGLVVDGGEGSADAAEKRPARRRRKRRGKPHDADAAFAAQPDLKSADEVTKAVGEEPAQAGPEADAAEPDEGRSKRRRKRRSSVGKKEKRLEPAAAPGEADAVVDEPKTEASQRAPAATKTGKSTQPPDGEDEPRTGSRAGNASHRGIPTWEETIGLIVSRNLEARSKKPAGGSSRDRSGGRASARAQGSSKGRAGGKRSAKKKKG